MKKTKEEVLNDFLGNEEQPKAPTKGGKKVIMQEREGLIERVDPVYVTKDGKQLLREQY